MSSKSEPLGKAFRYKELPKEVKQKLLTLQNGKGDYYRSVSGLGDFLAGIIFTIFIFVAMWIFAGLYRFLVAEGYLALWITIEIILFLWSCYAFISTIYEVSFPLKEAIYVTPTQRIEVVGKSKNPNVFCWELKDFSDRSEIQTTYTYRHTGNRLRTTVRYKLRNYDKNGSRHTIEFKEMSEAERWQITFYNWINYASHAYQQGNSAYFNSWDIFAGAEPLKSVESNPIRLKTFLVPVFILLSLILTGSVFLLCFYLGESALSIYTWEKTKAKNTATEYIRYMDYSGRQPKHYVEAKNSCLALYDEEIKNATNPVLKIMLESVRNSVANSVANSVNSYDVDNSVYVDVDRSNVETEGFVGKYPIKNSVNEKLKTNFPNEVLRPYTGSEYILERNLKPGMLIIKIQIQDSKSVTKKSKVANREPKFDFNCEIKIRDNSLDKFNEKEKTVDEFLVALNTRIGLQK